MCPVRDACTRASSFGSIAEGSRTGAVQDLGSGGCPVPPSTVWFIPGAALPAHGGPGVGLGEKSPGDRQRAEEMKPEMWESRGTPRAAGEGFCLASRAAMN